MSSYKMFKSQIEYNYNQIEKAKELIKECEEDKNFIKNNIKNDYFITEKERKKLLKLIK